MARITYTFTIWDTTVRGKTKQGQDWALKHLEHSYMGHARWLTLGLARTLKEKGIDIEDILTITSERRIYTGESAPF